MKTSVSERGPSTTMTFSSKGINSTRKLSFGSNKISSMIAMSTHIIGSCSGEKVRFEVMGKKSNDSSTYEMQKRI